MFFIHKLLNELNITLCPHFSPIRASVIDKEKIQKKLSTIISKDYCKYAEKCIEKASEFNSMII